MNAVANVNKQKGQTEKGVLKCKSVDKKTTNGKRIKGKTKTIQENHYLQQSNDDSQSSGDNNLDQAQSRSTSKSSGQIHEEDRKNSKAQKRVKRKLPMGQPQTPELMVTGNKQTSCLDDEQMIQMTVDAAEDDFCESDVEQFSLDDEEGETLLQDSQSEVQFKRNNLPEEMQENGSFQQETDTG